MKSTLHFILIFLLWWIWWPAEGKVHLSDLAELDHYFAEEVNIQGIVIDEDGEPLIGVNIQVQGSDKGTASDFDGRFELADVAEDAILVFSYVGYQTQEVSVDGRSQITVTLISDSQLLDEVVIVGYGTQRKGNLTGSVATISTKDNLEARPIADVGRAIQGAAAGLSVTIPSGEIGSDPSIKIRGAIGSFQSGSTPLILVDNVEAPSIQYVNCDDVESITVLKDAAASSIYGAKAAFGVILITTKTVTLADKVNINYSNNFSFQNPYKRFEMGGVNAMKYTVDALDRIGAVQTGASYMVSRENYERALEWQEKYGGSIGRNDPTAYGRAWYVDPGSPTHKYGVRTYDPNEYMIREWAPTQTHNAAVSGNVGRTRFNASFGALDQSGMMDVKGSDKFKRYNAMLKINTEITNRIRIRGGAIFSQRNKIYPYITSSTTADAWLYIYRWSALYPMGENEHGQALRSPFNEMISANNAEMRRNYVNLNGGGTIDITNNWSVDIDYSFSNEDYNWLRNRTRYTAADTWGAPVRRVDENGNKIHVDNAGNEVAESASGAMPAYDLNYHTYTATGSNPDHIYARSQNEFKHTINAYTTYNLDLLNDHNFKLMAGLNRVTDDGSYNWTMRPELLDINNPQFDLATGIYDGSGGVYWGAQLGYFGRLNYNFKDRYLLEGNIRYDGSSNFPTDLKWRWFPSMSAGWVISEEPFMEGSRGLFDQFKVRASWGTIGNQKVSSNLYVSDMNAYHSTWIIGSVKSNAVGVGSLIVPDVTWEDIETINFGVDFRFFNSQLGVTADVYQRNTNNMFAPLEGTTFTLGGGAPLGNFGNLETKGFELAMDYNHRFDNGLGINVTANLADAVVRVYGYTSLRTIGSNYDGRVYGEIWGYETDRLYQYDDFELDANGNPQLIDLTEEMTNWYTSGGGQAYKLKGDNPVYQPRMQNSANFFFGPGDVKFKDLNGDGEIDNGDGTIDNPGDMKVIGNSTPRYEYGFRIGADFKGFDLGVFFQGVAKRDLWGAGFLAIPGFHASDGAMPEAIVSNYWRPDHTDAFYPAAFNNAGAANVNNMQVQSRYLLDMSYMRIKNLTLGYTLPQVLMNRVNGNYLRVYVSLENFFTWDNLRGLPIDPEEVPGVSIFNSSNYNSGRTGVGIPTFKSASFGVQLNF